ncbi:MAG: AgmX/PglI C-terminal domain-containing protein [Myxococcales bacterium]|nr:AgmX/PglI C-terminal domain-containing protein [Myxococcales bacterium]
MREAQSAGDVDAALARCEEEHYGTAWRIDAAKRDGGTNGVLLPELIQAVVRGGFGAFRRCYEEGLRRNPKLAGRVCVGFRVGAVGQVFDAKVWSEDPCVTGLADNEAATCVAKAFSPLRFPKPVGGVVTVVYPITFSPGD